MHKRNFIKNQWFMFVKRLEVTSKTINWTFRGSSFVIYYDKSIDSYPTILNSVNELI